MNRQIKFRVWDTVNKEFSNFTNRDPFFSVSYGTIFFWDRVKKEDGSYDGDIILKDTNNRFILQQYTGLQDKSGKEVYEGDIVKTISDYMSTLLPDISKYSAGEVSWWNEGFALCQKTVGATRISEYSHCPCCPSSLEIIGNIFENPELLDSVV